MKTVYTKTISYFHLDDAARGVSYAVRITIDTVKASIKFESANNGDFKEKEGMIQIHVKNVSKWGMGSVATFAAGMLADGLREEYDKMQAEILKENPNWF